MITVLEYMRISDGCSRQLPVPSFPDESKKRRKSVLYYAVCNYLVYAN